MSSPVALILGAGPNIGASLSQAFSQEGYKVVVSSRSAKSFDGSSLAISADLTKPHTVHQVFEEVRQKFGEPAVVIYNGPSFLPYTMLSIDCEADFSCFLKPPL